MTDTPRNEHDSPASTDRDADVSGRADPERLARHLAARCELIERRHVQLAALMKRLDRRLRQVESRLTALANQAADQQESTRMICAILKDLDDPYGFGLSLDERLARDESDWAPDEERRFGNDPS
jgi:hypothetical protein